VVAQRTGIISAGVRQWTRPCHHPNLLSTRLHRTMCRTRLAKLSQPVALPALIVVKKFRQQQGKCIPIDLGSFPCMTTTHALICRWGHRDEAAQRGTAGTPRIRPMFAPPLEATEANHPGMTAGDQFVALKILLRLLVNSDVCQSRMAISGHARWSPTTEAKAGEREGDAAEAIGVGTSAMTP
jgi:hypothetical protein